MKPKLITLILITFLSATNTTAAVLNYEDCTGHIIFNKTKNIRKINVEKYRPYDSPLFGFSFNVLMPNGYLDELFLKRTTVWAAVKDKDVNHDLSVIEDRFYLVDFSGSGMAKIEKYQNIFQDKLFINLTSKQDTEYRSLIERAKKSEKINPELALDVCKLMKKIDIGLRPNGFTYDSFPETSIRKGRHRITQNWYFGRQQIKEIEFTLEKSDKWGNKFSTSW